MYISIAQSRQQLAALIAAAQQTPQIITKRNKAVAVLVSADYFNRSEAAVAQSEGSFFHQLMKLRATHLPQDDDGLPGTENTRSAAWSRPNSFLDDLE